MLSTTTLSERLNYIQGRIHKTAIKACRNPKSITLIAITKTHSKETWEQALSVNLTNLGESRIQEAQEKSETFSKRDKIELHLIGHLQSNKVRKAIDLFDIIQTVDSIKLAERINRISGEKSKKQHIYIQLNTLKDPKKNGFSIIKAKSAAKEISKMENINLKGIMTTPPPRLTPSELRLIYKTTREIRDDIRSNINKHCEHISMGMSGDYEIAISEGATHIRIGTGLFGVRKQ